MFSSTTCFLFIILTILPKSRTNEAAELLDETDYNGKKFEGFVVGGRFAKIQDFPHSAFLAISCRKNKVFEDFTCGSSILNQWILLTAAHCLEGCKSGTKVLASVGAAKKTKGTFYSVGKFASHKKYDGDIMKNDICLIMLSTAIVFGNTVKRIQLTPIGIYTEPAMLAGWGVTNEEEFIDSQYLKSARQVVMTREKCMNMLPNLNKGYFCATGDKRSLQDHGYAAVGDSGSALIVRGSIQIGIVSYKMAAISESLIAYTDVSKYYKWISNTAKALFCQE